MPEPGKTAEPSTLPTLAILLCTFLASVVLIILALGREPAFHYKSKHNPNSDERHPLSVTVMPFEDIKVDYEYSPGRTEKVAPAAIYHAEHDLICQLGAETNHFGKLDGEALARAFAQHLDDSGLFYGAHYVKPQEEFESVRVLVRGRVSEASLRIASSGAREYNVGIDFNAVMQYGEEMPPPDRAPLWQGTLSVKKRAAGRPVAYEINELLAGLFDEAAKGLRRKVLP